MLRRTLTALLFLAALAPAGLSASDWPRFRGPNGTGVADPADGNLPLTCDGDAVRWKAPIPGRGNSSPVVSKGRVFLESASEDGKARLLLCIDARTGKSLWARTAPGGPAKAHQRNSLASSTPAADGERVYALFWDGQEQTLAAYDYQGNPAWQRNLGPFKSEHGSGASPVVWAGKVFLANDSDESAALQAFDARTGKPLWETPRTAFRTSYASPFVLEDGGRPEVIAASTAGMTAYDPETGAVNWNVTLKFSGSPLRMVGSPVAGAGLVFATTGEGKGNRLAVAVRPGGHGDVTATHVAWTKTRGGFPYVPAMLVKDGYLYSVNDGGFAGCRDAKTGEEVWEERLGDGFTASPVLVGDRVYAVNERGTVYVFAASPKEYRQLGKSNLGEPVSATPAVADGCLFIRGKTQLVCVGAVEKK